MRITRRRRLGLAVLAGMLLASVPASAEAAAPKTHARAELVASGLQTATGSGTTIGPDGALYVTEGQVGRISRIDRRTGHVSTFADGLPAARLPVGGVVDVAFLGHTAYALVTVVGSDIGGNAVVGVYRNAGPHSWSAVADIGAWSIAHPSKSEVFIASGVQYAMEPYGNGFLVTDGHHNRVLRVSLSGAISEVLAVGNTVPTGLEVCDGLIYTAMAGPVPHLPEQGQAIAYSARHPRPTVVASGAPLLVDVEFGRHHTLYGLAQGHFTPGHDEGSPADPGTGQLMRANRHGQFVPVATGLDRPTSFEIVGNTAYVATLGGEVWRVSHL